MLGGGGGWRRRRDWTLFSAPPSPTLLPSSLHSKRQEGEGVVVVLRGLDMSWIHQSPSIKNVILAWFSACHVPFTSYKCTLYTSSAKHLKNQKYLSNSIPSLLVASHVEGDLFLFFQAPPPSPFFFHPLPPKRLAAFYTTQPLHSQIHTFLFYIKNPIFPAWKSDAPPPPLLSESDSAAIDEGRSPKKRSIFIFFSALANTDIPPYFFSRRKNIC